MFRYENFPVGTEKEFEVIAAGSCCLEGMVLELEDVSGNQEKIEADRDGTGTPMSKGLMWGLIIGAIILVILIGVAIYFCYRKKYQAVPS